MIYSQKGLCGMILNFIIFLRIVCILKCELFISANFHLIFPFVVETMETEAMNGGVELLYKLLHGKDHNPSTFSLQHTSSLYLCLYILISFCNPLKRYPSQMPLSSLTYML